MMRRWILALIVGVVSTVAAAESEWAVLDREAGGDTVSVDIRSFQWVSKTKVRYWHKWNYTRPRQSSSGPYEELRALVEVNCSEKTMRVIYAMEYMKGRVVRHQTSPGIWMPWVPDSVSAMAAAANCS